MLSNKIFSICLLLFCISPSLFAQKLICPGDSSINIAYFKNQSLFHKLSWLDKDGNVLKEATLNLVTKIDSVHHTMTYLQIRNDGKKDSSICEYPGLKPIYVSSGGGTSFLYYDYRAGRKIKVHIESADKPNYDTIFTMPKDYFDGFLSEYILGSLPLDKLQPLQFETYRGDTKLNAITEITKINKDILQSANSRYLPVFVLNMKAGTFEYLVYIDVKSKQILKTVFPMPDGGYFVKSLI